MIVKDLMTIKVTAVSFYKKKYENTTRLQKTQKTIIHKGEKT